MLKIVLMALLNIMQQSSSSPIPVASRYKTGSAAAYFLGLRVRIPPWAWILSPVSGIFCQAEASATGLSLIQRSPTECGVPEVDRGTS
jgi:hypothetical protein